MHALAVLQHCQPLEFFQSVIFTPSSFLRGSQRKFNTPRLLSLPVHTTLAVFKTMSLTQPIHQLTLLPVRMDTASHVTPTLSLTDRSFVGSDMTASPNNYNILGIVKILTSSSILKCCLSFLVSLIFEQERSLTRGGFASPKPLCMRRKEIEVSAIGRGDPVRRFDCTLASVTGLSCVFE